ncbi:universal stress protein, partial [Streptomyces sp. NPDC001478]
MTEQQPHQFERGTDGPKVIVAGIDGSESSMRAAAYAAGLARRQRAMLAL